MNILQVAARWIIRKSFHLSVFTIEQFYDIAIYEEKTRELSALPEGTLGKDIADCLEKHGLRLVPGFESHDMKHILLDFKMTPVGEIRLQAFMLGNGNYSPASFAIFLFGAVLLPDLWHTFYKDFLNGRKAKPISTWTIEEYAMCRTNTLREVVFSYQPERGPGIFEIGRVTRMGLIPRLFWAHWGCCFACLSSFPLRWKTLWAQDSLFWQAL
ncbi:hypothetical protein [Chitinophaga pinensis]|uniref:Uncharacterized protein n=1 Tax=Chitinophaga pinensis TaxID=79329 RepID=A0A5C6LSC7_9BACT|nr:hypothetical protein [Chitinophaga pinensis]TWV99811.1 hypothetical protein FEF09_13985 [Chitinophaga pinensis]